jgi:CRP-like cAMP-binding protein
MQQIEFTTEHEKVLWSVKLFRDIPQNLRKTVLDELDITLYQVNKGEEVMRQGAPCRHLYVLLEGLLNVEIIDGTGNPVQVEHIVAPRTFGTPHLFHTDSRMPATFTALKDSLLFTAGKESAFRLISKNPELLKSFLQITGNCTLCTVARLNALSRRTVRERFVVHLMAQMDRRTSTATLIHSQTNLASYLNVSRPALSTEMNRMEKEGLIKIVEGRTIRVLKPNELRKLL